MALRGKIGAHVLHATHDSTEVTRPAREAFLAGFARQVDPDQTLSDSERQKRAGHARRAHMARLALASARARNKMASEVPASEAGPEVRRAAGDSSTG
jgi:hypothetical protein